MKNVLKQVLLICLLVTSAAAVGLFAACTQPKPTDTTVTYTVLVQDETGTPLKDISLIFGKGGAKYLPIKTGEDGKAATQLEPDTYDVTFVANTLPDGYHAPENLQATKDNTLITVKLIKDFRYTVKLVNEDGTPFYQENVMLAICQLDGLCLMPTPLKTDGTWTYSDAEPGDYKVQISFPPAIKDAYTFEGNTADSHYYSGKHFSATETEMTVVIKPVVKTEYTVTVLKPDDAPAKDVYVNLEATSSSLTPVQTGADGKATIAVPAYGEYAVTLNPPEGFAFDYGAYKTTAKEHEITVKLVALNTLKLETEMTADEKATFATGFSQFADSPLPLFYSFKYTFRANETKYFAFTPSVTATDVIYCKKANTVFKVCSGNNSNFTDAERYTSESYLAQSISVTKGKIVYFCVTPTTAGTLEFVIGSPDPNNSSEVTFTGAGTQEITVAGAAKYATVTFRPAQSGVYEICSEGSFDTKVEQYTVAVIKIGENDDASATDKNFKISGMQFKNSEIGNTYIFRVFVKEGAEFPATFNVKITRTGDAEREVEYVTREVTATNATDTFAAGEGAYTEIDLATAQTVVKGEDGFYHVGSATGPVLVAKLSQNFRNGFGYLTPVNPAGVDGREATPYFAQFREQTSEYLVTTYDYVEFLKAYTAKCNDDGVYGVNDEIKQMLERWAVANVINTTNSIVALGTIATGNEWLVPCGYYTTEVAPPVEADVIVGKYNFVSGQGISENDEYILTVNANGTYVIAEDVENAEPFEEGTWVKNSENNYTFTYVSFMTGTYTVTRDAQGKLTFMEDQEEPEDEPYYVCEVISVPPPPAETDAIVGEYIFESKAGNKTLSVKADKTYELNDGMGTTSGTWVKNENGSYTFTEINEVLGNYDYFVVRDAETGKISIYDLEADPDMPVYEFTVYTASETDDPDQF